MKKLILSMTIIAAIVLTSCKDNVKTDKTTTVEQAVTKESDMAMTKTSFGVRGNCGMCKSTIEKAVNAVEGISKVDWDKDKKKISVAFDGSKTNEEDIHNAIATSGYDTEKVASDEEAYSKLPECCQYDHNMAMNQE